ncbi:hypothetical protein CAPTEDRAFT_167433 [Capitella teleta]|uniref:Ciliary microtubule inner protein 2C n=1 Tax=Capitella teleta TaxID=283909 RepID=R7TEZ8_CAPTE|nr:hypothetical protein CAPTEDRAFT_167433 [Capitella teleta]|eukprot:ELT89641.1 hypothetical protein CAPTEDRAFT_167433 [Capitella teleta]
MSKSAGTLHTTHNATYIHPRFMPGYRGYVPTMKFSYGETYGNQTNKYFQDFRSTTLDNSKTNYCKGGYFPTYYTHSPELATSERTERWDRWLNAPRYTLTNRDHDRQEDLMRFGKMTLAHREHYNDKSGERHQVEYFHIPTKAEDQFRKHIPFNIRSLRYTDDICIPDKHHAAHRLPITKSDMKRSNQRDREIRDIIFEKR